MIEGIIYKYTSPSGKCYIGQTTNEKIRREHWNTIVQYNTEGSYLNNYSSVREASDKTKIKMCNIYKCLFSSNRTAGGFI